MSTKVEQASTVKPPHVQTVVTADTSAASTSSPKISMFASKSGFVIPKNKLSGSLVPIYRGGKKPGGSDAVTEESTKPVQRKTKWGPDLTQDAVVRKGRALAYQTRVEQITKQLNSRFLEIGANQESPLGAQVSDHESPIQIKSENTELLELEKREAIGEILKLNPTYKAPLDYKPLLKEARVPVPIKEYPGNNFITLIFGPASDTQKRLEKETGAKIRVYGTKADTGVKGEIALSDGSEAHGAYMDLYVQISADTYEKVDAAVALIELLVTPVSANPSAVSTTSTSVSGENVNVADQSQGTSAAHTVPVGTNNIEVAQPIMGSTPTPPQGQFQPYRGPWFPVGPPQIPMRLPSGFVLPSNSSAPILGNPFQASSLPFNPSNMPSLFGPRPILTAGVVGSVPQNPSFVPSGSQPPVLQQRPFMPQAPPPFGYSSIPRNLPPSPQPPPAPAQHSILAPPPFTGNQPSSTGLPPPRPLLGPSLSQPMSMPTTSGLHPVVTSQAIIVSGAPLSNNISAVNMVSPLTFPSRPSGGPNPSTTSGNYPIAAPPFTSGPLLQSGLPSPASSLVPTQLSAPTSAPRPIQSSSPIIAPMRPVMAQAVTPNPSPNSLSGPTMPISPQVVVSTSTPPPSHSGIPSSVSGSAPSFTPIKPPSLTAPKPLHPNSSDFTFQPHRPQNLATQVVPRPGIQSTTIQNVQPPNPTAQPPPLAPNRPSFWPAMHNSSPQPVVQGISRPQLSSNHMNQPQTQISPFPVNPTVTGAPLRHHPTFPNPNPGGPPASPVPQMGPRNLIPAPHMGNMGRPFLPPRPGNPMQLHQNYPAVAAAGRPRSFLHPNQQLGGSNLSFASGRPASSSASGAQQNYDPFSPTSVSNAILQGGNPAKTRKQQESDPEYEDLMASVGVK